MKLFNARFSNKLFRALEQLQRELGKANIAEVMRMAVALLLVAKNGHKQGLKVALINQNDKVEQIISIPWVR